MGIESRKVIKFRIPTKLLLKRNIVLLVLVAENMRQKRRERLLGFDRKKGEGYL
jgi:hypothetical protein